MTSIKLLKPLITKSLKVYSMLNVRASWLTTSKMGSATSRKWVCCLVDKKFAKRRNMVSQNVLFLTKWEVDLSR